MKHLSDRPLIEVERVKRRAIGLPFCIVNDSKPGVARLDGPLERSCKSTRDHGDRARRTLDLVGLRGLERLPVAVVRPWRDIRPR